MCVCVVFFLGGGRWLIQAFLGEQVEFLLAYMSTKLAIEEITFHVQTIHQSSHVSPSGMKSFRNKRLLLQFRIP